MKNNRLIITLIALFLLGFGLKAKLLLLKKLLLRKRK